MGRLIVVVGTVAVALVLFATPAWAHVKIEPASAPQGSDQVLSFVVPNEMDNATVTKIEVQFPTDHPIAAADTEPMPGWTSTVRNEKSAKPIQTDDGEVNEQVQSVTWTAAPHQGIPVGNFETFQVSIGLPDDATSLNFPTIQTYSNDQSVSWVQVTPPGGPEPDNPVPTITLTSGSNSSSATTTATTTNSSDDTGKTLGIIGIIVGAIGLIVAIVALLMSRRKPSATEASSSRS